MEKKWEYSIFKKYLGEAKKETPIGADFVMQDTVSPSVSLENVETARESRYLNCISSPTLRVPGIPSEWLLTSGDGVRGDLQETVVIRSNSISALPVMEVILEDSDPLENFEYFPSCPDR